jgi:ABC-type dipeptide/oligopeptide/nickel transport system ATPase subunit
MSHQQQVLDIVRVHCQQGGFCLIMGEPGTGKSVLKRALCEFNPKRLMTPVVNRTLHTYHSTPRILCEAFQIEAERHDVRCERRLIAEARRLNAAGKMLAPIIDDAHLMDVTALRKIRLLFEDFPKNHCLVLVAQPELLRTLILTVNDDLKKKPCHLLRFAQETGPRQHRRLHPGRARQGRTRTLHFQRRRAQPHRPLLRRRPAQDQKSLPQLPARGGARSHQRRRAQAGQPRLAPATLAQRGRPAALTRAQHQTSHGQRRRSAIVRRDGVAHFTAISTPRIYDAVGPELRWQRRNFREFLRRQSCGTVRCQFGR